MDATKGNIYTILNGNKQFLIPVYQRYYSWETEQCSRLWKDIVDMQKKGKIGHFVGSIVNIAELDYAEFVTDCPSQLCGRTSGGWHYQCSPYR